MAALAAAAGGGTAWWRSRSPPTGRRSRGSDVWSLTFPKLDGTPVRMADLRGRPLLLNFWATWCAPCVTEMPLLDQFARSALRPVGKCSLWRSTVPTRSASSSTERSLRLPVAFAGAEGIDLSRSLGNRSGALPFSVVFDSSGRAVAPKPRRCQPLRSWPVGGTYPIGPVFREGICGESQPKRRKLRGYRCRAQMPTTSTPWRYLVHTMDLRKLKTLIDLVSESNISELEIAEADGKVRIVKAGRAHDRRCRAR